MTGTLKSILRNRLRPRRNKKFVALVKEKYPHLDLDHLIAGKMGQKKPMDYLLSPKNHELHIKQHYNTPLTEDEFMEEFIQALEIIFDILDETIK
jgi:hypothetical protein